VAARSWRFESSHLHQPSLNLRFLRLSYGWASPGLAPAPPKLAERRREGCPAIATRGKASGRSVATADHCHRHIRTGLPKLLRGDRSPATVGPDTCLCERCARLATRGPTRKSLGCGSVTTPEQRPSRKDPLYVDRRRQTAPGSGVVMRKSKFSESQIVRRIGSRPGFHLSQVRREEA